MGIDRGSGFGARLRWGGTCLCPAQIGSETLVWGQSGREVEAHWPVRGTQLPLQYPNRA